MMKLFIASDIHGSARFCREMLAAFQREGCEKMLLLGDFLYHGPRNDLPEEYNPKDVIAQLSAYSDRILAVRGNCDGDVDQMVLPFPILADYAVLNFGGRTLYATHGHVYNPDHLPPLQPGDILLNGHTHVPAFCDKGDFLYMNPGSVSIPKEGSHHQYILMDGSTFTMKDLDGTPLSTITLD